MSGTTVSYDHRAVTIDGKRTLLLSGAIHYPRSTPSLWPQLMSQSRAAGLNAIETYVFWNLHERRRGVFDFSEHLDLVRFCQVAQEHGLSVILRIGPYICAETNYGGFPAWLRDIPGMQMRTFNQPFMREMERWVRMVTDYLRPLFAPQGGPIMLFQLENEYNNIAKNYGEDGQRYLQWASHLAQDLHLGIPVFMCLGAAPGCLETINTFYGHMAIDKHTARHADQPCLWTEAWLAWYDTYGYAHKTRSSEDCAYAVARFIAAGGTGINYYMWHGGTNFGRSAMYLQTTSYDYDAPLNEYGCVTAKARHLARLNTILNQYADLIVSQERPVPLSLGEGQYAYTYRHNERELSFLCNDTAQAVDVHFAHQLIRLPARSVSLLNHAYVLMNTAEIKPEHCVQQHRESQPHLLTRICCYEEPLPSQWPDLLHPTWCVTDMPVEQLQRTQDDTDYCWYSTDIHISSAQAGAGVLTLQGVADMAYIFVDGHLLVSSSLPLLEDRGPIDDATAAFTQTFALTLSQGTHVLSILTCALGLIKGDWMLGNRNMVEERKGLWGQVWWNTERVPGPWSIAPGLVGEHGSLFGDAGALVPWQENWQTAVGLPLRWWRLHFARPQQDRPLAVDLTGMGKGMAWLNGRCIGRYWLTPGTSGALLDWQRTALRLARPDESLQRYYHLPADWLRDQNVLVLFEESGGDPSQITFITMECTILGDSHS